MSVEQLILKVLIQICLRPSNMIQEARNSLIKAQDLV